MAGGGDRSQKLDLMLQQQQQEDKLATERLHKLVDYRKAEKDFKDSKGSRNPRIEAFIADKRQEKVEGGTQAAPDQPLQDNTPPPVRIPGGDANVMDAIGGLMPAKGGTAQARPGFEASTSSVPRFGRSAIQPWADALTGFTGDEGISRRNRVSYNKNEQLIDEQSTALAYEYDSLERGNVKSGDELSKRMKSIRAETGPFVAETINEAKRKLGGFRNARLMGETKAQKEFQMGLVERGVPPNLVGSFGAAYKEGPEALAREIQSSGWKPKPKEADLLAAQIQREKLYKLERENRIGNRDEATYWQAENLRVEREGLSGAVGYRLSEEQAGWTKPQVDDRLTKLLAGGVDSEVAGMLPGLQKAKLALDDEMVFAKDGNVFTGDSSYSLRGKDVILAFAEADGRRPRRAPVTAAEKEREYGPEANGQGIDQNATLAYRRERAKWLVDNIQGLESFEEVPMPDGTVNFAWDEDKENRNTPFIMHIQDIAAKHEQIEKHKGRELNQYMFGNREMIRAARGVSEIAEPKPEAAPAPRVDTKEEKAAVEALGSGASKAQIEGAREGARMVGTVGKTGKFIGEGLMEIPRTFQRTGQGMLDLGKGLLQATGAAAEKKAARDKAFVDTLRNRK